MDGRLDTPVADAVERHLAGCADCVAAVHDARGAIAESRDAGRAPFAFHRVVSEALHGRRRHRESPLVLVARWSIAVAAGAAACWIGFTAGAGVAPNGPVAPADDLLDSMTFGLLDGDAEGVNDDLLQFALAASSVGLTEAPR